MEWKDWTIAAFIALGFLKFGSQWERDPVFVSGALILLLVYLGLLWISVRRRQARASRHTVSE